MRLTVRPCQIGSPMMRTGRPSWTAAKASSTCGMIRRIAAGHGHVLQFDVVAVAAQRTADEVEVLRGYGGDGGLVGVQASTDERHRSSGNLFRVRAEQCRMREAVRRVRLPLHGRSTARVAGTPNVRHGLP
jgi:hypothetical protein